MLFCRRAHLAGVVACVGCDLVFEEPARCALLPGLMAQLSPGYVDAVVLAPGAASEKDVARVQELVQQRNPSAAAAGAPRAAVRRAAAARVRVGAVGGMRVGARADLRRGGGGGGARRPLPQLPHGALQALRLSFKGELDPAALAAQLDKAGMRGSTPEPLPLLDAGATPPTATRIVAAVGHCAATGVVIELHASRLSGLRAREWPLQGLQVYGMPLQGLPAPGGEVVVLGTGLVEGAVRALLEKSGKGAGGAVKQVMTGEGTSLLVFISGMSPPTTSCPPSQPRTAASLTAEERSAIAKEHLFDELPEGTCFDGSKYRDEFGDVLREHPHMDRWGARKKAH